MGAFQDRIDEETIDTANPPPLSKSWPCVDKINHPPHYAFSEHEPIKVIRAWGLGFSLGNAVKYIARAGRKDPTKRVEDLKKARWYLDEEIVFWEGQSPPAFDYDRRLAAAEASRQFDKAQQQAEAATGIACSKCGHAIASVTARCPRCQLKVGSR